LFSSGTKEEAKNIFQLAAVLFHIPKINHRNKRFIFLLSIIKTQTLSRENKLLKFVIHFPNLT
jgi:hypothetical protein